VPFGAHEKPSRGSVSIDRIPVGDASESYSWPDVEGLAPLSVNSVCADAIDLDSLTMLSGPMILFQAASQPTTQ
jgi:hypothetical protein